jgi:hypothetical protein
MLKCNTTVKLVLMCFNLVNYRSFIEVIELYSIRSSTRSDKWTRTYSSSAIGSTAVLVKVIARSLAQDIGMIHV